MDVHRFVMVLVLVVEDAGDPIEFFTNGFDLPDDAGEAGVDGGAHGVEPRIDGVEPRIDGVEPRIDGVEPRIGTLLCTPEPAVDAFAQRIDAFAQSNNRHASAADHSIVGLRRRCRARVARMYSENRDRVVRAPGNQAETAARTDPYDRGFCDRYGAAAAAVAAFQRSTTAAVVVLSVVLKPGTGLLEYRSR